jgi:hypothetical protein
MRKMLDKMLMTSYTTAQQNKLTRTDQQEANLLNQRKMTYIISSEVLEAECTAIIPNWL